MWNEIICSLVIYVIYLCIGACLFHNLTDEGLDPAQSLNHSRKWMQIKEILYKNNYTHDEIIDALEKLRLAKQFNFIDETSLEEVVGHTWTFFNSFFFCLTLTSTIGYGNVAPKTSYGMIVCLIYIVVGIPVHIVFVKVLSDLFGEQLQKYTWMFRCESWSMKMNKSLAVFCFCLYWTFLFLIAPSVVFMHTEQWTFMEGVYYCYITLATIGLGDYVAGNFMKLDALYYFYKVLMIAWLLYGMTFIALVANYCAQFYQKYVTFTVEWKRKVGMLKLTRAHIQMEKLDIHFRLFRSMDEGAPSGDSTAHKHVKTSGEDSRKLHLKKIIQTIESLQQDIRYELHHMQRRQSTLVNSIIPLSTEDHRE